MIIKCLTGSASRLDGPDSIIRYIFRGTEPELGRHANWQSVLHQHGVLFDSKDIKYLQNEAADSELLKLYEECNYDIAAFMERISGVHLVAKVNIRARDLDSYEKAFKDNFENRLYKSANSIGYQHYILSFSPKEEELVTKEILQDFATQFCTLRGENNIYLAAAHLDENPHVHCLVGSSTLRGLSSSIRKSDFENLKKQLDLFQREKYPQLVHSLPQHGKGKLLNTVGEIDRKNKTPERVGRVSLANECLAECAKSATSATELFAMLSEQGIFSVYTRSGRPQGLLDNATGMKMRWKNFTIDIPSLIERESHQKEKLQEMSELRDTRTPNHSKINAKEMELTEEEALLSEFEALRSTVTTLEREIETSEPTQVDTNQADSTMEIDAQEPLERDIEQEDDDDEDEEEIEFNESDDNEEL